jgi:hypothetical protein
LEPPVHKYAPKTTKNIGDANIYRICRIANGRIRMIKRSMLYLDYPAVCDPAYPVNVCN